MTLIKISATAPIFEAMTTADRILGQFVELGIIIILSYLWERCRYRCRANTPAHAVGCIYSHYEFVDGTCSKWYFALPAVFNETELPSTKNLIIHFCLNKTRNCTYLGISLNSSIIRFNWPSMFPMYRLNSTYFKLKKKKISILNFESLKERLIHIQSAFTWC